MNIANIACHLGHHEFDIFITEPDRVAVQCSDCGYESDGITVFRLAPAFSKWWWMGGSRLAVREIRRSDRRGGVPATFANSQTVTPTRG